MKKIGLFILCFLLVFSTNLSVFASETTVIPDQSQEEKAVSLEVIDGDKNYTLIRREPENLQLINWKIIH